MKHLVFKIFAILILFSTTSLYSQEYESSISKDTLNQLIDAYLVINYNFEDAIIPQNSVFYFDNIGAYWVKASNNWNSVEIIESLLVELEDFSKYKLISNTSFKKFDRSIIKETLLKNSRLNHLNIICIENDDFDGSIKIFELNN